MWRLTELNKADVQGHSGRGELIREPRFLFGLDQTSKINHFLILKVLIVTLFRVCERFFCHQELEEGSAVRLLKWVAVMFWWFPQVLIMGCSGCVRQTKFGEECH